jgi:hypothetical protein
LKTRSASRVVKLRKECAEKLPWLVFLLGLALVTYLDAARASTGLVKALDDVFFLANPAFRRDGGAGRRRKGRDGDLVVTITSMARSRGSGGLHG